MESAFDSLQRRRTKTRNNLLGRVRVARDESKAIADAPNLNGLRTGAKYSPVSLKEAQSDLATFDQHRALHGADEDRNARMTDYYRRQTNYGMNAHPSGDLAVTSASEAAAYAKNRPGLRTGSGIYGRMDREAALQRNRDFIKSGVGSHFRARQLANGTRRAHEFTKAAKLKDRELDNQMAGLRMTQGTDMARLDSAERINVTNADAGQSIAEIQANANAMAQNALLQMNGSPAEANTGDASDGETANNGEVGVDKESMPPRAVTTPTERPRLWLSNLRDGNTVREFERRGISYNPQDYENTTQSAPETSGQRTPQLRMPTVNQVKTTAQQERAGSEDAAQLREATARHFREMGVQIPEVTSNFQAPDIYGGNAAGGEAVTAGDGRRARTANLGLAMDAATPAAVPTVRQAQKPTRLDDEWPKDLLQEQYSKKSKGKSLIYYQPRIVRLEDGTVSLIMAESKIAPRLGRALSDQELDYLNLRRAQDGTIIPGRSRRKTSAA